MTVSLTHEQEARLRKLTEGGQSRSAGQFIDYVLALLDEDAETTAWLGAQVTRGIASLGAGRYSTRSTQELAREAEREGARQH